MFQYSTIKDHNRPNRVVTVNAAQTKPRFIFQNEDGSETHEINAYVYHIYASLYNKLLSNHFNATSVFLKDIDVILTITVAGNNPELPVHHFADIAVFRVTGSYKPLLTFDNLLDLAVILSHYEGFTKDIECQKSELHAFYDINLKGKSICDYNLGSDFHYEAEQNYFYKQTRMDFQHFLTTMFIPSFARDNKLNADFVAYALRLYENWQEYSNRVLTLYGTTPKIPKDFHF